MTARHLPALLAVAAVGFATAALAADLSIQNTRASGFSDTTPATPVGINPGTTRGDQALIVFQTAGAMWGATVRSTVPIIIDSEFNSAKTDSTFTCSSDGTVLAYTEPTGYITNPGFPNPSAGYPIPLANALTGMDHVASAGAQFQVNINADLGTSACDFPAAWYFGLDTNIPDTGISLLTTLQHEFGHGLGFSSLVNPANGQGGPPLSIFDFHIWDVVDNLPWVSLSSSTRANLVLTPNSLAFQGPAVQADIPTYLAAPPNLSTTFDAVTTPLGFTEGQFSGPLQGAGTLAATVPLDACSDLTNGAAINGKFALMQRSIQDAGSPCAFLAKTERALDAGAIGVVIFDSEAEDLIEMAGEPAQSIPAVFISQSDGTRLLGEVEAGPVSIAFGTASQVSNTGPGPDGGVLLYTPSQFRGGSSLIHWNVGSYPHTLMLEYANEPDIRFNMDFTPDVMSDMGWSVVQGLGVSVVKLLDPEVPAAGQVEYLIAVMNRRPTSIDSIQVDLALPGGTTFVSNVSSPAGCETAFPCTLQSVPAGGVILIVATFQVPADATSPFNVTATLTPSSSGGDDSLTSSTSQTVATGGDLKVSVTGPSSLAAGTSVNLTTTVTNTGPGDAAGVLLTGAVTGSASALPTFVNNGGACANGFPCSLGTVASGQQVTVTTTFTVPTNFQSGAQFTATVTSTTPDSNAANNSGSFSFAVGGSTGSSGCSTSGEPATLLGVFGLALVLLRRKRLTF